MSSSSDVISEVAKAKIVELIISGKVEEALGRLADLYGVSPPRVKVGRVKGKSRVPAVYVSSEETIYIQDGSYYNNPFIVLHEFYHHIRMGGGKHRGTEGYADRYALDFIKAYKRFKPRRQ
jgi:hypothetical protein